jgi:hypothetical protein
LYLYKARKERWIRRWAWFFIGWLFYLEFWGFFNFRNSRHNSERSSYLCFQVLYFKSPDFSFPLSHRTKYSWWWIFSSVWLALTCSVFMKIILTTKYNPPWYIWWACSCPRVLLSIQGLFSLLFTVNIPCKCWVMSMCFYLPLHALCFGNVLFASFISHLSSFLLFLFFTNSKCFILIFFLCNRIYYRTEPLFHRSG